VGRLLSEASLRQNKTKNHEILPEKQLKPKRAGGVAQVIEGLPNKCNSLVQTSVLPKGKKEVRER
jgi:hypothetical protein